jgi:rhodanese-related sulfurtransferase
MNISHMLVVRANRYPVPDPMQAPKTATQLVHEARQRIENLSPHQLAAELERGDVLLVDLREAEERTDKGAIPGAVHAPRGMLEFYADPTHEDHRPEFHPKRRTILYCAGGSRSALAVQTLHQLGYTDVAHLERGFTAWARAGHKVIPA